MPADALITALANWLMETSWQVAVLVVVIATLQRIFGRWMSPGARYAMWMLVAVRLAIPLLPASPSSVYNLLSAPSAAPSAIQETDGRWTVTVSVESPEQGRVTQSSAPRPAAAAISPWRWRQTTTAVWLAVAGALGMRMLVQMRRIRRIVAGASEASVGAILLECQQGLRLRRNVRVLESRAVLSPAVFGLWQASILLPDGLTRQLTPEQLRLVILHELVHIRRLDHWTHRALLMLQVIHWFNPAVYFAFSRCQLEREVACDEAVLRHTGARQSEVYGQTLLDLSARIPHGAALTHVPAMAEGRQQLRRRIQMIASGSTTYRRSALLAGMVIAVTAMAFVTRAQLPSPAGGETGNVVTPPTAAVASAGAAADRDRLVAEILAKPIPELRLEGSPFEEVIDFLRDTSGANLFVNWKALEAAGVQRKTPITCRLRNVSFRKALGTVLDLAGAPKARLAFDVNEGVIMIGTADSLEGPPTTRVYDVTALLIDDNSDSKTPAELLARKKQSIEEIATLIRETVKADKWIDKDPAAKGTIRSSPDNQQLVITQTLAAHEAIRSLLDQLRETLGVQVTVECRFICLDPTELPKDLRRALEQSIGQPNAAAAYLSSEQVAALIKAAQLTPIGSLATAPRVTVFNGRAAKVYVKTLTPYVSAFTVGTDASGQAEYRPVISEAGEGITLSLRANVSADRKYVVLYLHPLLSQLTALETIPWSGNAAAGQNLTVQKPRIETSELETLASVPDKGTLLLGGLAEVRMDGGKTLLRRPTTTPTKGQQPSADGKWLPVFMLVKPTTIVQLQTAQPQHPLLPAQP